MRRQIQLWGTRTLVVALIAVAAQRWGMPMYKQYFSPKKSATFVPTTKVQKGKFTVSFHEIGNLDAEKSVPVNNDSDGKIITLVEEGTVVKTGDKIAEMDTTDAKREERNQRLAYENSLADVKRAEAELEILKASNQTELEKQEADYSFNQNELALAEKQRDKKKRLADEKLVPRDQVDQAEMEVRSKQLAVTKGEKDLALKRKDIASKESQKLAEVNKVKFAANIVKSNWEEQKDRVKSGVITAPAGGMVVIAKTWAGPGDYRKLQAGDSLHHRQTICNLPDLSKMLMKVNVGESDAPRVKVGLQTLIKLEAVPDKVFHGAVKQISSLATEGNMWETGSTPGRKNFEVTIEVKESDPKILKPGMTGDVEFICDSVPNAVSVPLETIIEQDGKTFAYVKVGKTFKKVSVKTGKFNDNYIIITKGLKKGDIIALRDPTRPMDQQEAGSSAPGNQEQTDKEQPASAVPGAPASAPAKK